MREYSVDPLEALFVREVMRDDLRVVRDDEPAVNVRDALERDQHARRQRLYPVVGEDGRMAGVVGWSHLVGAEDGTPVSEVMHDTPLVAYDDEVLRSAALRMAANEVGALPVVARDDPRRVLGIVTEFELLGGRRRQLVEERHRERALRLRVIAGRLRRYAARA